MMANLEPRRKLHGRDIPLNNLSADELQALICLPPFNRVQLAEVVLQKMLKHLLPYQTSRMLNDILCRILSYLPGTTSTYDTEVVVCSLDPQSLLSVPERLLRACPAVSVEDLTKFTYVNYAVKQVYERKISPISWLGNDVLELVLDRLNPQLKNLIEPWKRANLSVESFVSIPPPPQFVRDSADFNHLSRVCHKFLVPGRKRLFVRITVRFSHEGFRKLRRIADRPLLASSVKKFSYMMPRFYSQDRAQFEKLLQAFSEPTQIVERERFQHDPRRAEIESHIRSVMHKAEDQNRIIDQGRDIHCLLYALSRFKNLQQIRLMRVEDDVDRGWLAFLDRYPEYRAKYRPEDWARSCEHAAKALAYVLNRSDNQQLTRFSSRFMEPSSPLVMTRALQTTISTLAERLLALEMEFVDERSHRTERMAELSELFGTVFRATVNLQCLHVGFRRRMSGPLSLLFHNVQFHRLVHLGLHMWDLDSDELIILLQRHPRLESIRLRHISLKQQSNEKTWEKVLRFIRLSFPGLDWISLRGASYDPRPDATTHAMGGLHFAPPHQPQPHPLQLDDDIESDSDISNFSPNAANNQDADAGEDNQSSDSDTDVTGGLDSSEAGSDDDTGNNDDDEHDSDLEEEHQDLSFETSVSADNTNSTLQSETRRDVFSNKRGLRCDCENGFAWDDFGLDDLGDNGVSVTSNQWKRWGTWVEMSCIRHDPRNLDG